MKLKTEMADSETKFNFIKTRRLWTTYRQNFYHINSRTNIISMSVFVLCVFYILCVNESTSVLFSHNVKIAPTIIKHGLRYVVDIVEDEDTTNYRAPLLSAPSTAAPPPTILTSPVSFYHLLMTPTAHCRKLVNIGGYGCTRRYEGNKDLCLDPEVMPPRGACLVYSFGVAYDITFEDSVLSLLDCQVHLFDPTITFAGWQYEPARKGRFFHMEGLSDRHVEVPFEYTDGNHATMKPFGALVEQYSGSKDALIHYLKIDIEGDEWKVLRHMIDYGQLDNVIQLALELHSLDLKTTPSEQWLGILQERHNILTSLEVQGFRRVRVQNNEHYLCKLDFSQPTINQTSSSLLSLKPSSDTIPKDKGPRSSPGNEDSKDQTKRHPVSDYLAAVNLRNLPNDEIVNDEEEDKDETYELVCQEVLYVRAVDNLPLGYKINKQK